MHDSVAYLLLKDQNRSIREMDQLNPEDDGEEQDVEKQDQVLRFEDRDQGAGRPQVNTAVEKAMKQSDKTPRTPAKRSIFHSQPVKDLDPAADRLAEDLTPLSTEDFNDLMGLNEPTGSKEGMGQIAKPHGLYAKMYGRMRSEHHRYRAFAIAVYVFLVLQLVIAAVFIILGSLPNFHAHIVIAILGAISTVIAGALGLMQGQGLPNRLRQVRDNLRNVLFEAEELYWDMRSGRPVLYKDIKKIREDYLRVLEEQRTNRPDVWNAMSKEDPPMAGKGAGGKK